MNTRFVVLPGYFPEIIKGSSINEPVRDSACASSLIG